MKKALRLLTRRDFARCATIGAAATVGTSTSGTSILRDAATVLEEPKQTPTEAAKLSPQSLTESEARYQAILQQYGERFSDAQKTDIRRLCIVAQQSLDAVRAYPIGNGEQPSLYLKPLVERDKKSSASQPAAGEASRKHNAPGASTPGKPQGVGHYD